MSKNEAAIAVTKNYEQLKVMLEEAEIEFEEGEFEGNQCIDLSDLVFHFADDGSLLKLSY